MVHINYEVKLFFLVVEGGGGVVQKVLGVGTMEIYPRGGGGGVGQGHVQHQYTSCSDNSLEEFYLCLLST